MIIRRYQDFWRELAQRRAAASPPPPARPDPRRLDPYWLFAGYATAVLDAHSRVRLAPGATLERLRAVAASALIEFGKPVQPADSLCRDILERLARGPCTVAALAEALAPVQPNALAPVQPNALAPAIEPPALHRAVVWLNKLGLVDVRASSG